MLATADLPPVGRIDDPWVGTKPVRTTRNPAATTCDRASFAGAGAAQRRSRTFLVPQADVPARFGLTETYGRFRTPRAAARFLADVRRHVAGCEKRDLATSVDCRRTGTAPSAPTAPPGTLTTEVSKTEKVALPGRLRAGRPPGRPADVRAHVERRHDRRAPSTRCWSGPGERLRQLR